MKYSNLKRKMCHDQFKVNVSTNLFSYSNSNHTTRKYTKCLDWCSRDIYICLHCPVGPMTCGRTSYSEYITRPHLRVCLPSVTTCSTSVSY